jgi:hypothetical protein
MVSNKTLNEAGDLAYFRGCRTWRFGDDMEVRVVKRRQNWSAGKDDTMRIAENMVRKLGKEAEGGNMDEGVVVVMLGGERVDGGLGLR